MTTPNSKLTPSRFHVGGIAIGVGIGAALCVSSGPAIGIPIGVGLAVVFGLMMARKG